MYESRNKTTSSIPTASHSSRILEFVTGGPSFTLTVVLAFALCLASIPAVAQGHIWQVDPQYSFASLSLVSGSQSQEIDVAPVCGKLVFDASDPANAVVDLDIKPGSALGLEYSEIRFKSKRSVISRDGELAVVGDLSLTRVERSATWDPSEAYRGPEYGEPTVRTDTREVTLVFPGASLPADQSEAIRLSASSTIGQEDFPQLLALLESSYSLSVVAPDEDCTVPSTIGEDYSGLICTGTPVATATNPNQATIALDMKLTQPAPTPAATAGSAE